MSEEMMAYCMKEKKQQPMKDVVISTTSNGRRVAKGVCTSCGTKMNKFLAKETTESAPVSAAPESGMTS